MGKFIFKKTIKAKKENIETFLFIADFHSLTQIKNSEEYAKNTHVTSKTHKQHKDLES